MVELNLFQHLLSMKCEFRSTLSLLIIYGGSCTRPPFWRERATDRGSNLPLLKMSQFRNRNMNYNLSLWWFVGSRYVKSVSMQEGCGAGHTVDFLVR